LQEEALVVLLRSYYARLGVALYYHKHIDTKINKEFIKRT
jgi:hypothetical protein